MTLDETATAAILNVYPFRTTVHFKSTSCTAQSGRPELGDAPAARLYAGSLCVPTPIAAVDVSSRERGCLVSTHAVRMAVPRRLSGAFARICKPSSSPMLVQCCQPGTFAGRRQLALQ
jgi:hypothetical protein